MLDEKNGHASEQLDALAVLGTLQITKGLLKETLVGQTVRDARYLVECVPDFQTCLI